TRRPRPCPSRRRGRRAARRGRAGRRARPGGRGGCPRARGGPPGCGRRRAGGGRGRRGGPRPRRRRGRRGRRGRCGRRCTPWRTRPVLCRGPGARQPGGRRGTFADVDLRLRELGAMDPLAVPLPNGTEVTTRVDRVLSEDRRVPQGAVGRVVAQREGELDVMIVGVGVLRYARSEVVPRKIGQVRYARRRAEAWGAL